MLRVATTDLRGIFIGGRGLAGLAHIVGVKNTKKLGLGGNPS